MVKSVKRSIIMSEPRKEYLTMTTQRPHTPETESLDSGLYEYKLAVIKATDSRERYGIAARSDDDPDTVCVREIGADEALVRSMVDTLNRYRIPYVHVFDVISDLMNEHF